MLIFSCAPNSITHFDGLSFSSKIVALRDIKEGEEILISYANPTEPTAERQQSLASYGFVCECPRCTNPNADEIYQGIVEGLEDLDLNFGIGYGLDVAARTLGTCSKWLAVIEAEGLQMSAEYDYYLDVAVRAARATGKLDDIKKYEELRTAWHYAVWNKTRA